MTSGVNTVKKNFIRSIIDQDLSTNKNGNKVITRFPPEPNGYLHIGHAKAICLNFGIAEDYSAQGVESRCHLRFDDTNPEKEDDVYVRSIIKDVEWLGFSWGKHLFHASDYFEELYRCAIQLIEMGKAYVCELSAEEMREYRGNLKEPGRPSPHRNRSVEENLKLFQQMKDGGFAEGKASLRAKIDMNSANINMRDPVIYRVKKVPHQRVGNTWVIYPMYDFTHCLSDSIEGITHSLCSLEFEDHRPLYDWFIETLKRPCHPQQIEFARLNLEYTITSKRWLKRLVDEKLVSGWDDPRMPTISGLRRRGIPPEGIKKFCDTIGLTKKESSISMETFESVIRDVLEHSAPRLFAVIDPLLITVTNWEGGNQEIDCPLHPQKQELGSRKVPFSKQLYIERSDFMENAPKKFFRLTDGGMVRLKYAYVLVCDEVIKDSKGTIQELKCRYLPDTFAGVTPEGMKKVKGIINWVSADQSVKVETRIYDRLFKVPNPLKDKDKNFLDGLNPHSLEKKDSFIEAQALPVLKKFERVQFERQGYFAMDSDHTDQRPVINRVISLKDTWAKAETAID